jgi:imidazolonepropionase-like amidohydrolase
MKNLFITIIVIIGLTTFFTWLPTPKKSAIAPSVTIISNAVVFDGQQWLGHRDVAFEQGFIIAVAPNLSSVYPKAVVVDATGKYLIPGLIDAHTHAWDNALRQAVKFGVTTELDMFTNNVFAISQRALSQQHSENIQQADFFSAGTLVTSPKGHGTEYGFEIETIDNPTQAPEFVAKRIEQGSDYIKIVYNASQRFGPSIDKATLQAVINASHQQGKLAVVHISDFQSAQDAINTGADGLVHGFMDKVDIGDLASTMAKNQQFVIPTLSILASMTGQKRTKVLIDDFSQRPKFNVDEVIPQLTNIRTTNDHHQAFLHAQSHVLTLAKAGVMILAGSDAPNPGTAHGISLHGELALLVEAGLSNNQALMAATSNPANAFKLKNRGYIKSAMKADFVLLNQDPQQKIEHTRTISSIYKNGFTIDYNNLETTKQRLGTISLGDFEKNITSELTTNWQATTDERFGGDSQVTVNREVTGQQSYLTIDGSVGRKFSYPWAGAYLPFSLDGEGQFDLTDIVSINLNTKGTTGGYKIMIFSTKQPMRPIEVEFNVTNTWQSQQISLKHIPAVLLGSVSAIAIVGVKPLTKFTLLVDDIWLSKPDM